MCVTLQEATLYVREGELNDKFYSHPTGRWSKIAYKILHHPIFHIFDLTLSILLMLLALIEKPPVFGTESDEQPLVNVNNMHTYMHKYIHSAYTIQHRARLKDKDLKECTTHTHTHAHKPIRIYIPTITILCRCGLNSCHSDLHAHLHSN